MYLRNSIKALIIEDGKILLIRNADPLGPFYLLPGGGQLPGETVRETLLRECREELGDGLKLEMGDLSLMREYISTHHEFKDEEEEVHQIELMFRVRLYPGYRAEGPSVPDQHQVGTEWIPLERLKEVRIYPRVLAEILPWLDDYRGPIYLGDVN